MPSIPSNLVKDRLPLSTLNDLVNIYSIEIIDAEGSATLFKAETRARFDEPIKTDYYLTGFDEQQFIVKLPETVGTVKDALESL